MFYKNLNNNIFKISKIISEWQNGYLLRRGVVNRVPAFQPSGVRNFNFCPGIGGVCPLPVFCPVLSSAEALTLCWPHIQGDPPLCISLVFWSRDCCSPYRHLTHGHLACKSLGVEVLDWGRVNKRRRRRRRIGSRRTDIWLTFKNLTYGNTVIEHFVIFFTVLHTRT